MDTQRTAPVSTNIPEIDPNISTGLQGISVPQAKAASVEEATRAKQILMGGADTARAFAAAKYNGNDLASDPVYQDLNGGLSYGQLVQKYGHDIARASIEMRAPQQQFNMQMNTPRSGQQVAKDTALDFTSGAVNATTGLLGLGAGLLSKDLGVDVAQAGQEASTWLRDQQSSPMQSLRDAHALMGSLDQADNAARYKAETAKLSPNDTWGRAMAGLRQIGRDAADSITRTASDPAMLGSVSAEGLGSLVPSVGTAKFAQWAAKGGSAILEKLAVPLAVGTTEAGGTYAQTVNEIMGMSPDELTKSSETYREMRSQGMGHAEAQKTLANATGIRAAGYSLPAAIAAGKLAEGFEVSPLKGGTILNRLSTVGKETVEEAMQGAASQISTNRAMQQNVDASRSLVDGVGEQIGQGAIGGFGMAGALQGPGAIAGAGKVAVDHRLKAGERKSIGRLTDTVEAIKQSGADLAKATEQAPITNPEPSANAGEPAGVPKDVGSIVNVTLGELQKAPENVQRVLGDGEALTGDANMALSRSEVLFGAVVNANKRGVSKQDREDTALWISDQINQMGTLDAKDFAPFGPDAVKFHAELSDQLNKLKSEPIVASALERASKVEMGPMPELTSENLATPETRAAIQKTALVAQANPAGIDTRFAEAVLEQSKGGQIEISPESRAAIQAAVGMKKAGEAAQAEKQAAAAQISKRVGRELKPKSIDMVRADIHTDGLSEKRGQYSLNRFVSDIGKAMQAGNLDLARRRMESLRNFGLHFDNKLEALGRSADLNRGSDNQIRYKSWDGRRWHSAESNRAGKAFLNPKAPSNLMLAAAVAADAKAVRDTYNTLLEVYGGQLEGTPLSEPKLHPVISSRAPVEAPQASAETGAKGSGDQAKPKDQQKEPVDARSDEKPKDEASARNVEQKPDPQGAASEGSQEGPKRDAGASAEATDANPDRAAQPEAGDRQPAETVDAGSAGSDGNVDPFANLYTGPSGRNLFREGVTLSPEKGPLLSEASPISAAVKTLSDPGALKGVTGLGYHVDAASLGRLSSLVQANASKIVAGMNALMDWRPPTPTLKNGKPGKKRLTLREKLAQGGSVETWRSGRIVSLLDAESGKFDPRLIESAALAAMSWSMTATGSMNADREDVARALKIPEAQVTADMLEAARSGMQEVRAAESLAREILTFWGATLKSDAPMNEAQGIAQQLAAEMLGVMAREDMVKRITVDPEKSGKDPIKSIVPQSERMADAYRELGPLTGLLHDTYGASEDQAVYFDAPPKAKPGTETQKRNPAGKVSPKQATALENHRKTVFRRNTEFASLLGAIGQEALRELMGYVRVNPERMNASHAKMVRGKNNSIDYSLVKLSEHDMKLHAYAAEQGKDPSEVETYFDWYLGRNGRIMARGFTGQADKLMRETYTPTTATLDLTTDKGREAFWLTVAQGSDMVKTERMFRAAGIEKVQKEVRGAFTETLKALENWLVEGGSDAAPFDYHVLQDEIRQAGAEFTPKLLHSLLAVARYDQAMASKDEEDRKGFWHHLSLEADGVTDGPVNALMHFTAGEFDEQQLENMARGGVFLDAVDKTLNQFYEGGARKDDIYQTGATALQQYFGHMVESVSGTAVQGHMGALRRVLGFLGEPEFGEDGTTLTFGRNVLKNPLTISVYGSGISGISGKIVGGLVDALYERMSSLADLQAELKDPKLDLTGLGDLSAYEQIYADLALLATSAAYKDRETGEWRTRQSGKPGALAEALRDPRKFAFSRSQLETMTSNVRLLYGESMERAIDEIMGETKKTMQQIQAATQTMSAIFQERFAAAVKETLDAKIARGELDKNQKLSERDYNDVFRTLEQKYGAIIESGSQGQPDMAQHVNLSGGERGTGIWSFFRTLDEGFSANATMTAPSSAGVSAAPMLTISRGDGQMMVNYFAAQNPDLRVLQVYDGLEMPADAIEEISRKINEAVFQAWQDNPALDVFESYADFLRQDGQGPLSKISKMETFSKLARALGTDFSDKLIELVGTEYPENADLPAEALKTAQAYFGEGLARLRKQLEWTALQVTARKRAMARVNVSVDHMASGETPFNHSGDEVADPGESTSEFLNRLYNEELDKLVAERKALDARPKIEKAGTRLRNLYKRFGTEIEGTGVHTLKPAELKAMMKDMEMPAELRRLFESASPRLEGFTLFLGSQKNLNAYYRDHFLPQAPRKSSLGRIHYGLADLQNGALFITNPSPETIVHEILHTAVARQVSDFYLEPGRLTEAAQRAMGNLDTMLEEFRRLDLTNEPIALRETGRELQNQIEQALAKHGPEIGRAIAMNEFMAWGLTNQNIMHTLRRTKVRSKLARIAHQAVNLIKELLGIGQAMPTDMLGNLRFNAEILMHTDIPPARDLPQALYVLNQVTGEPNESGLRDLAARFQSRLDGALADLGLRDRIVGEMAQNRALEAARRMSNLFTSNGFGMTPAGKALFEAMQVTFATAVELDHRALIKAEQLYDRIIDQLDAESFLEDPANADDYARERAHRQFMALTGQFGGKGARESRGSMIASFLALSQVSPVMREALGKIEAPKDREISWGSLDSILSSAAESAMNSLASVSSGLGVKPKTNTGALDMLVDALSRLEAERENFIEREGNSLLERGDAKGSQLLERVGDRIWEYGEDVANSQREMRDTTRRLIHGGATALAALLDQKKGSIMADHLVKGAAQIERLPKALRDLVVEVMGVTDSNWGVLQLVNKVRYQVSALRQDYREELPKLIAKKFGRELSKQEWSHLHLGLGRTDIASVMQKFSVNQVVRMLRDKTYREDQIAALEETVDGLDHARAPTMLRKAEELARFMVTGKIDAGNHNLLRNATAIAQLLGERGASTKTPDAELVKALDTLVSLKALALLDKETRGTLASLANDEKEGMSFLMLYLGDARLKEQAKSRGALAELNGYKGFIPSERRDGASLVVADDMERMALEARGYTRVGDYSGPESAPRGYYFSAVSGRGTYQQGVLQTVQSSSFGVNVMTGYSVTGTTGGVITGIELDDLLADLARGKGRTSDALIPVYDAQGELVAYERSMDPAQISRLDLNTHVGEMIGAWSGRQAEEELSQAYNEELVNRLKTMWDEAQQSGEDGAFVDIFDKSQGDAVLADTARLIPAQLREYIRESFGGDSFMVRRDLVDNALGYRLPSVTDAWTGDSRLHAEARKMFQATATVLLGNNAFKYLATAEKGWQTLVSQAKHTIVISSIIVPVSNLASNFFQLMQNGVGPRAIYRGMTTKLLEIEQHQRNLKKAVDLRAELARHRTNPDKVRKLQARLDALTEADRRMSIWPLIEAGEFSTISEGMTQVDAALASGKWGDWIKAQIERVPAKAGTFGRYALMARDTALFQGMARATQYGDFLAKAVLYEHLVKKKGVGPDEALRKITEEFVNYNFLPGRSRSYADSMGLTWFWTYKLRSMKVALNHLRNNPLRSMLMGFGMQNLPDLPGLNVGLPMDDNMVPAILDGRLGNSVGPDMLFRAPSLNPWYNLTH